MQESSVSSFLKFTIGFMLFISMSFGITYAVNAYTSVKDVDQMAAAALADMLQQKK